MKEMFDYAQTLASMRNLAGGVYGLDIGPLAMKRAKRGKQTDLPELPKIAFCCGKTIYEVEIGWQMSSFLLIVLTKIWLYTNNVENSRTTGLCEQINENFQKSGGGGGKSNVIFFVKQ